MVQPPFPVWYPPNGDVVAEEKQMKDTKSILFGVFDMAPSDPLISHSSRATILVDMESILGATPS